MPLRSLRLSLRFVVPLALVLGVSAYVVVPLMENLTVRWFVRDLDIRSQALALSLQEPLRAAVAQQSSDAVMQLFNTAIQDERLYALGFCDNQNVLRYKTATYPVALGCWEQPAGGAPRKALVHLAQGPVHVADSDMVDNGEAIGKLILIHDMSFVERRSADAKKFVLYFFALLAVLISIITVLVAHLSLQGWINGVKSLLRGEMLPAPQSLPPPSAPDQAAPPEMQPLMGDLRALLHDYQRERQSQQSASELWTPNKLKALLQGALAGDQVLVVSNREPYIHVNTEQGVAVQRPASGLVTAVEAVMRACSGTWIAHGGGSADRQTVDRDDHVPVPPEQPSYTLRRVWLNDDEERGYYYGFSNEGLWPLCHIAHVRPVFRSADWAQYVAVNRRFAEAVIKEARGEDPVVLVQDYHLALLPRMVREALPKATIITFWHIPWPNSESFGICPWREQILDGLLGSTILGFHTPFHCKNFLENVDRYMETRIESETSTITYGGELTQVQHYPISIAWPDLAAEGVPATPECRSAIRQQLGLGPDQLLGVGVDRLDYTKGIIERFQAIQTMFEQHPDMAGRFTFAQIAAPSRSSMEEYQHFELRVRSLADKINQRFGHAAYSPIVLNIKQHDQAQLQVYYRAADVCMVTSLHDGMNLVAKEFVAARDDESGVLILSQFTGAARELHEALIINPYHIEQGAAALYKALLMPAVEQRERMRSMRARVKDFNVYRWAGRMLQDAARLRQRARVMSKIDSHSRRW